MFQAPFFQGGRPWGAYRSRVVQISLFIKKLFSFFILLSIYISGPPICGKWGSRCCVVQVLESWCRFLPPLGEVSLGASWTVLHWKSNTFCIVSMKIIKNLLVFHQFWVSGGSLVAWLASGGPGPPPWDLFSAPLGALLVLESFLGSFLVAFGVSGMYLGIIFGLL